MPEHVLMSEVEIITDGLAARKCSERALRVNEAGTADAARLRGGRAWS